MKLRDANQCYQDLSGKLSDLSRQLAFAAIALVWIFKTESNGRFQLPNGLLWVAIFAVAALLSDFLQYAYSSLVWGWIHRSKEKELKHDQEKDFRIRREINWPTIAFYWGKTVSVALAYFCLLRFLIPLLG